MVTITQNEFQKLSNYIRTNYGIHLKEEKKSLLTGRLQQVLLQEGFNSFTEYYYHLIEDKSGSALSTFIDKITTNHTYFMRESDHFFYFQDTVLPYLKQTVSSRDLRIWCAASSTGEEPYTLAMILDEFFGKEKPIWDTKILATDISSRVLEIARRGIYDSERIEPLPSYWKTNYLQNIDGKTYAISAKIKNEVIFRKLNLMDKFFPFKQKFHVIFCRNVMIYFDNETKEKLINKLYDAMEYGGFLFVGHSEWINREATRFKFIKPAIYRKEF
jgi:chemotaxis protein methyltransferase CheR